MVAWRGGGAGITARRFDASGNALDGEFKVNTTFPGEHGYVSQVAHDARGNFVVAWNVGGPLNVPNSTLPLVRPRSAIRGDSLDI